MKRGWVSRAVLVSCLLFVLLLAGCDFFAGIFDPLIGTWVYSLSVGSATMSMTFTFHGDETWEAVMTATGQPDETGSGTYTHDAEAGTLTMTTTTASSGGPEIGTVEYTYELSSDKKTLTLTEGGYSVDFTRE